MSWSAPTTPVKKEEGTLEGSPGGSEPMDLEMMSPSPSPRSRDDSSIPGPSRAFIPMVAGGHRYFMAPLPRTFLSRIPVSTSIRPGVRPVQHPALAPRGLGLAPTFFKPRFNKSVSPALAKAKHFLILAEVQLEQEKSSKSGPSSGPSAPSRKPGFADASLPTSPQPGCSTDLVEAPPKPGCFKPLVTPSSNPDCSKDAWKPSPKPGCSKDMYESPVKSGWSGGKMASSLKPRRSRGPLASSRKFELTPGKLSSAAPNLRWNNYPMMSSLGDSSKAPLSSSTPKPMMGSPWSGWLTQSRDGNFDENLTPSPPRTPSCTNQNFAGPRAPIPKKANRCVVTPIKLSLSTDSSQASVSDLDISMISNISDDHRTVSAAAALDEDKENRPELWKDFDARMNIFE